MTTQNDTIADMLLANRGEWIPMTKLGRAAGCWAVHSRVADLRKRGLTIQNRRTRKGRKTFSFYRVP